MGKGHADYTHSLGHHHEAPAETHDRAFGIGVAINVIYILFEVAAGLMVGSLALLADAGHNASDVISLLLAWGASRLGRKSPTQRRTYGLRRTTILASLVNGILLLIAIGAIAWEAIGRFVHPQSVPGLTLVWVASIGVVINTVTAFLFFHGRKKDLNIKAAFLHMAADAAVSLGVVIAGLLIRFTNWMWIDPAISLAIVVVIGIGTWGLLRDSFNLAVDSVPAHIDPEAVLRYLEKLPGISAVHDLHIWAMSTTEAALTAHLIKPDGQLDDTLLERIEEDLHKQFGIQHVTIQFEQGRTPCQCPLKPENPK